MGLEDHRATPAGICPDPPTEPGASPRLRLEILMKKAAIDPDFKELVLKDPLDAAKSIDLPLTSPEVDMLFDTPKEQLRGMIENISVNRGEHKILKLSDGPKIVHAYQHPEFGANPYESRPPVPVTGMRPDLPGGPLVNWTLPVIVLAVPVIVLALLVYFLLRWLGIL